MNRLLEGIRVLDFGRYVAGPYCATLLGFLGADVIRIEKKTGGEDRHIAPFPDQDCGGLFAQTACNKRSLALDFRDPETPAVIDALLASADVVVANLPAAALERMGIDQGRLQREFPRMILASQSAFGEQGPLAGRGGFDGVAQAMSGAMFMSGSNGQPVKAAAPYVDFSTAVLSAFGVLAALMQREQSGQGQHVETNLLHTAMAVFGSHLAEQSALGVDRQPSGNRVQTSAPSDVFATRDGHVLTHVVGNGLFKRCARLLGRDDWLSRDELLSDQGRGDRRDELCEAMRLWCAERDSEQAISELAEAGIPSGPVLSLDEALELEQAEAMNVFHPLDLPGFDSPVRVPDMPVRFSGGPAGIMQSPPELGAHNREILEELGFPASVIERLA